MKTQFGDNLKSIRTKKGLTMQQVADKMGISRQNYNYYEKLENQPSYDNIERLSKALDIDPVKLMTDVLVITKRDGTSVTFDTEKIANAINDATIRLEREQIINEIYKILPELNYEGVFKVYDYLYDLLSTDLYNEED